MSYYGKYGDKSKCSFHIEGERYKWLSEHPEGEEKKYYAKGKNGDLIPAYKSSVEQYCGSGKCSYIDSNSIQKPIDKVLFDSTVHDLIRELHSYVTAISENINKINDKYWKRNRIRLGHLKSSVTNRLINALTQLLANFYIEFKSSKVDIEELVCDILAFSFFSIQDNLNNLSICMPVIFEMDVIRFIALLSREYQYGVFLPNKTYHVYNKLGKNREFLMNYLRNRVSIDATTLDNFKLCISNRASTIYRISHYHNLFKNQPPITRMEDE